MKIARFKATDCNDLVIILEAETLNQLYRPDCVRISEVIEVEFPPRVDVAPKGEAA